MTATVPAVAFEASAFALFPSIVGSSQALTPSVLATKALWSAGTWALSGALVVAVYARFQAARHARNAFNKAELERAAASREVLASRLAAMQARVEPQFLLGTLAQVEALYERDPDSGVRMLDSLIAYLRAALPQLRSEGSTLTQEARLAESYLCIVELRMGSRLDFEVDIPPELTDCAFPPMLLLPLIDDALGADKGPAPSGVGIAIRARAKDERLHVVVAREGPAASADAALLATLRERLEGMYGDRASLSFASDPSRMTLIEIEVPHETASASR
jgi:LytS/YehU family sensor histidine kinase